MQILVMGGTRFVGRVFVERAVAAGHDLTLFNRGVTGPDLFGGAVHHLRGDRDHDLTALTGRSFDAVVDPSAYFPRQVTAVVDALEEIGHYTLVSSISAYADHTTPGQDEDAALATVADPEVEELGPSYGGFKALCEAALEERLPGRVHQVRAGLIIGRHDNTGRFPYWVRRLGDGGKVLAPQPRDQPVQLIDVVDLADWMLHAIDHGVVGPHNASGAPGEHSMWSMLRTIAEVVKSPADLVWVDQDFLVDHGVTPFVDLPFWLPPSLYPEHAGHMAWSTTRARMAGLTTRPLAESVLDTWRWLQTDPGVGPSDYGNQIPAGMARGTEAGLLEAWQRHRSAP